MGVQRAEDQHAHRGTGERELDRIQLAHLAQQKDIGVVAHGARQRIGKGAGGLTDLAVDNHRRLVLAHDLDRVLDRDDVVLALLVQLIDEGGEGGGLPGAKREGR